MSDFCQAVIWLAVRGDKSGDSEMATETGSPELLPAVKQGNSSVQDFALAAKSVKMCKSSQEGICPRRRRLGKIELCSMGRFRNREAEG